jgi:hypothetical protein
MTVRFIQWFPSALWKAIKRDAQRYSPTRWVLKAFLNMRRGEIIAVPISGIGSSADVLDPASQPPPRRHHRRSAALLNRFAYSTSY